MASLTHRLDIWSDGRLDRTGILPAPVIQGADAIWQIPWGFVARLGKTKGDTEMTPHEGLPATVVTGTGLKFRVTSALMAWMNGAAKVLHPDWDDGDVNECYQGLYRNNGGWCNQTGIDSDSFRIAGLNSEGNNVRSVTAGPIPQMKNFGGEAYMQVMCMDPAHPPPPPRTLADLLAVWWMFFWPTTARTSGSNGFPNGSGRIVVPFLGEGGIQWIKWNNDNAAHQPAPLVHVPRLMNPMYPANWSATVGVIDP